MARQINASTLFPSPSLVFLLAAMRQERILFASVDSSRAFQAAIVFFRLEDARETRIDRWGIFLHAEELVKTIRAK